MSAMRKQKYQGCTLLIIGLCALMFCLQGCSEPQKAASQTGPRELSSEEAYRFASLRFRNFDAGVRHVTGDVIDGQDRYDMTGWIDFSQNLGYVRVSPTPPAHVAPFLVNWTKESAQFMELSPEKASEDFKDWTKPEGAWESEHLDPQTSVIARALYSLLLLGGDRPENPLLIQQGSARWLREEKLDGQTVDVMTGPDATEGDESQSATPKPQASQVHKKPDDRVQYWVNRDGLLKRLQIRLKSEDQHSDFRFDNVNDAQKTSPFPSPVAAR